MFTFSPNTPEYVVLHEINGYYLTDNYTFNVGDKPSILNWDFDINNLGTEWSNYTNNINLNPNNGELTIDSEVNITNYNDISNFSLNIVCFNTNNYDICFNATIHFTMYVRDYNFTQKSTISISYHVNKSQYYIYLGENNLIYTHTVTLPGDWSIDNSYTSIPSQFLTIDANLQQDTNEFILNFGITSDSIGDSNSDMFNQTTSQDFTITLNIMNNNYNDISFTAYLTGNFSQIS